MPKRLIVFEHEHLHHDEKTDFRLHHWQMLSDFNERNQNKYFTITSKGVKFSQYVGVIQVGKLTIEILPKIDKTIPTDIQSKESWHTILLNMLKVCHRLKTESLTDAHLKLRNNSILDWYIELFLNETQMLIHEGLVKKYRKQEENSLALKGQLKFAQHIQKNSIHQERFYIKNTIYDRNNILNRILGKTLEIIHQLTKPSSLTGKLNRLLLDFPDVSNIVPSEKLFLNIKFDRKTERYRKALQIARLLLLNYSPDIRYGQDHVIALLFDMNKLWEQYITIKLREACASRGGWVLQAQRNHLFWSSEQQSKNNQPDILIFCDNEQRIVIDTKWKLIDERGPSENDLRQVFVYGQYYNARKVFLLYPSRKVKTSIGRFNDNCYDSENTITQSGYAGLLFINIIENGNNFLKNNLGEEIISEIEKCST